MGVHSIACLPICWVPYLIKHNAESRANRKFLNWALRTALAERVGANEMKPFQGPDSTSLDFLEGEMVTKRPIG